MSAADDKAAGTWESKRLELELRRSSCPLDRENAEKLARYRQRVTIPDLVGDTPAPTLFPVEG